MKVCKQRKVGKIKIKKTVKQKELTYGPQNQRKSMGYGMRITLAGGDKKQEQ